MSEIATISVNKREKAGRSSARDARRKGMVPAVIYGSGGKPTNVTVRRQDLLRTIEKGGFLNTLIKLDMDGEVVRVLPKDVQLHPLKDWPEHVDFFRMPAGSRTVVNIPVEFKNQEISPGIKRGGILNVVRYEIELNVDVDLIPSSIVVNLAKVNIGASIHISDVDLPEGVKPTVDRDFTIATIAAPSGMAETDDEDTQSESKE